MNIEVDENGLSSDYVLEFQNDAGQTVRGVMRFFNAVVDRKVGKCEVWIELPDGTMLKPLFKDTKVVGAPSKEVRMLLNNRLVFRRLRIVDADHRRLGRVYIANLEQLLGVHRPEMLGVLKAEIERQKGNADDKTVAP